MPSDVLCAQLTRDQFAIAKFLFCLSQIGNLPETFTCRYGHYTRVEDIIIAIDS